MLKRRVLIVLKDKKWNLLLQTEIKRTPLKMRKEVSLLVKDYHVMTN